MLKPAKIPVIPVLSPESAAVAAVAAVADVSHVYISIQLFNLSSLHLIQLAA